MSDLIEGVAKIAQNHYYNGNEVLKTEAENGAECGVERGVNAETYVSPLAYKYVVDLRDLPVYYEQIKALDPNLRMTKGLYMIKYTPRGSGEYRKGRPFKLGQDLIRWDIRVSGPADWNRLCDRIPELGWLRRNSTFTDRMFDLAAKHPGMSFWYSLDWVRYEDLIQSKTNTVLEHPLVSRKVSAKDYNEIYKKNDKALMIRYLNDIIHEVQEIESSPAVQEEMITATGESGVVRKDNVQPKDPVTGQFISRKQKEE